MNSVVIIIASILIFIVAYATYGSFLYKKWGIDPNRPTPAHTREDGVDYCPAKAPILLGHHFASIAGAGPILGPIQAAVFGWVPVVLWILIGSIFFGGVHDMGSLFTSVRNDGHSIGEVVGKNMGKKGKTLFSWFAWLTLLLVVASFTSVCASTFVSVPQAGTSSMLFILLAIVFGFAVYRRGAGLLISSILGVVTLFFCIWLGMIFPLKLSYNAWVFVLLIYIAVASIVPVWILLQPRDYLNSFLLYAMMIGAVLGIIVFHPAIKLAPVTAFNLGNNNYLFPMLFVTVACGAISGFHSLVGSGTTSKQLDSEKDIKLIGYGAMLIEGVLAVIAIITAAYLSAGDFNSLLKSSSPTNVFATGCATFMNSFGIPLVTGKTFISLAVSAFALTSLDTATRLGRFIFQEMFDNSKPEEGKPNTSPLTNKYVATIITVVLGGALTFKGYAVIWPIFGSANQLLAAIALLSLAVYLRNQGKDNKMAIFPTIFMFAVTLSALVLLIKGKSANFGKNWLLITIAAVLFILAIILIVEGVKALKRKVVTDNKNVKA